MRDLMELHTELQRCLTLLACELPDTSRMYLVGAVHAIEWALGKNNSADGATAPSSQHMPPKTKGRVPL